MNRGGGVGGVEGLVKGLDSLAGCCDYTLAIVYNLNRKYIKN